MPKSAAPRKPKVTKAAERKIDTTTIKDESVNILSISAILVNPNGGFEVIGLGSDKKVYKWDYTVGEWIKNWNIKSGNA